MNIKTKQNSVYNIVYLHPLNMNFEVLLSKTYSVSVTIFFTYCSLKDVLYHERCFIHQAFATKSFSDGAVSEP